MQVGTEVDSFASFIAGLGVFLLGDEAKSKGAVGDGVGRVEGERSADFGFGGAGTALIEEEKATFELGGHSLRYLRMSS
jgi:hypothetical protein